MLVDQVRKDVGGLLSAEDILPNSDSLVVFSARGYLKRMPADTFTAQVQLCPHAAAELRMSP